jgi:outer membrane protein assembly factor BamA
LKTLVLTILLVTSAVYVGNSQPLEKSELSEIRFEGNKQFSSSDLKALILSKETPFWFWKFLNSFTPLGSGPVYLEPSYVEYDMAAIRSFYQTKGFFETKVSYKLDINAADNKAELTYKISEGDPAVYGDLKLLGFANEDDYIKRMVEEKIDIDLSQRYDQGRVQKGISEVILFLKNNGFLTSRYDSTVVNIDSALNKANLTVYFSPGKIFRVNELRIEKLGTSSSSVSEELIRDISNINQNDIYSVEKLSKSELRLARTGLFSSVSVEAIVNDTLNGFVPVIIQGSVASLNELSPELLMDNDQNAFNLGVRGNYIRKNFLGDARKFTITTSVSLVDVLNFNFENIFKSPSKRDSTYRAKFEFLLKIEQPFIFNRPIYGNFETYFKSQTRGKTELSNYGGKFGLEFEMPDYTFVNLLNPYINLENVKASIGDVILFRDNITNEDIIFNFSQNSLVPVIGIELGASHTDDLFFPAEGYNISLSSEGAFSSTTSRVGGNYVDYLRRIGQEFQAEDTRSAFFYRLLLNVGNYFNLSNDRNTIFAIKSKVGYIQTFFGGDELIPPNRTFFAGGSNSVRGWQARQLTPQDQIKYAGILVNNELRGGTFMFEGSVELRRKFLSSFGFVVFGDFGNVFNSYTDFAMNKLAAAAGFGIRYYSPIAPFRIDFGTKFYDPADKKFIFEKQFFDNIQIHFGIGEAF